MLGAAGMIAVGVAGVIAPKESAQGYGVACDNDDTAAYVRAAAVRDAALGLILLRASNRGGKKALRAALACATLLPLADMLIVASRTSEPKRLAVHAAGFMGIAAAWALATFGESGDAA
jgi:hypothetical protein